jgi:two-component system, NarL family, nitrate/nitrite response regulator NarL
MITIVLADNHPVVRAGLRALLSEAPDLQIVGEAENGNEAQQLVRQLRPRILLLDLKIPGLSPTKLGKWVRAHSPETVTLALTAQNQEAYLANLIDAGFVGLLSQETSAEKLIEAVRGAAQGEILFDEQQLDQAQQWRAVAGEKWKGLSRRQKQVLQLMAQGVRKKEVVTRLEIGMSAVGFHIVGLLKKLKFKSMLDAVCWLHKYFPDGWGTTAD